MLKDLIEFIAQSLVDHPEQVKVREIEEEKVTVVELSVAGEDLGKVIGKGGRTAKAMRAVLLTAGVKANKKTVLEIIESH
ncbi:MAG: KH domain-containing protein [Candidatus Poribacteria bacterium]|nr:KH domain-containing protein [Candidatus Poribacteria bacterium]